MEEVFNVKLLIRQAKGIPFKPNERKSICGEPKLKKTFSFYARTTLA